MTGYKSVTLRFPADLHKRLACAMLDRDIPSLQVLMTDLLTNWLDKPEKASRPKAARPAARNGSADAE